MACLLALKRHHDCLSLLTREVKQGRASADVFILRARLYNFFQKVVHSGQGSVCPGDLHPTPKVSQDAKEARPAIHTVPKDPVYSGSFITQPWPCGRKLSHIPSPHLCGVQDTRH